MDLHFKSERLHNFLLNPKPRCLDKIIKTFNTHGTRCAEETLGFTGHDVR